MEETIIQVPRGLEARNRAVGKRNRFVKLRHMIIPVIVFATLVSLLGNMKTAYAATTTCPPTIAYGSTGSLVRQLQQTLDNATYLAPSVDGQFGPQTRADVITYQKAAFPNDSTQWDGVVGPHTWGALGYCHTSGGISGGGCTAVPAISACISVGSGYVLPDGYINANNLSDFFTNLIHNGTVVGQFTYTGATGLSGRHFYGPDVPGWTVSPSGGFPAANYGGSSWVETIWGVDNAGNWYLAVSPAQYT